VLRVLLAIWAGKLATIALRALGRAGTHVPGLVARKIHPGIIGAIRHPATVIVVTGTNGKTTVSNMLTEALLKVDGKVVSNRTGSNLAAGVTTTLIGAVGWSGRPKVDIGVFEMDERSAKLVLPGLRPDILVATNLTRDSIKRNAHPEYIAWILSSALSERTTLVLNADDLIVASLGTEANRRVYFGVDRQVGDGDVPTGAAVDAAICPVCDHVLEWDYWRYNHIGKVRCPSCGFHSPDASYRATGIDTDSARLDLDLDGTSVSLRLINQSIVNVYNQLAVATVLDLLGWDSGITLRVFEELEPPTTRFDTDRVGDVFVVRILTKGLVGVAVSRAFEFATSFAGRKAIVLAVDELTERENEVENTAWTYDADYEYLADDSIGQIVVGGVRRHDQALRLAIAGVDPARIVTVASETAAADLVDLADVDIVFNLHSVHNAIVTGTPVQRRLRERLEQRS
jgi:UDP-N-acetylmuramyl tripeptide synthase